MASGGGSNMSDFSRSNARNRREFEREKELYEVEPLGKPTTLSWQNLSEIDDEEEARVLDFRQLNGKKMCATPVRRGEHTYWKLYIVDHKYVSIVYVESFALNPIRMYRP